MIFEYSVSKMMIMMIMMMVMMTKVMMTFPIFSVGDEGSSRGG